MPFPLAFILFFLFATPLSGQQIPYAPPVSPLSSELDGTWVGELTQNEGGIADRFDFFIQIRHHGIFVNGTTYVSHGPIYVEMEFSGFQQTNGIWKLTETKIVRGEKPEDLSWCMKIMELRLTYLKTGPVLSGPWYGNSAFGPCVPGSVRLRLKKGSA